MSTCTATAPLPTAAPARLAVPRTLGPYRVLGRLGRGGMAHVLRAVHTVLGREVALKVLPPGESDEVAAFRRFRAEGRAQASVRHPHLLACHDAGTHDGWCYLAMELAEGRDLARERKAAGGSLDAHRAARLIRDVAGGVAALHRAGHLHRDIKPANILLDGDGTTARLGDFGAAVAMADEDEGRAPVVGTPAFMAPEHLAGHRCDARCDVYGLGATLAALVGADAPAALLAIIARATAACRDDRHPSAAALAADLDAWLAGPADQGLDLVLTAF